MIVAPHRGEVLEVLHERRELVDDEAIGGLVGSGDELGVDLFGAQIEEERCQEGRRLVAWISARICSWSGVRSID